MSESAPRETFQNGDDMYLYIDLQSLRYENGSDLFIQLQSSIGWVWMITDNSSLLWESKGVGVYA